MRCANNAIPIPAKSHPPANEPVANAAKTKPKEMQSLATSASMWRTNTCLLETAKTLVGLATRAYAKLPAKTAPPPIITEPEAARPPMKKAISANTTTRAN